MTGFLRRVGLCLVAYAALAWVPLVTSEYHTHILVISLYYVILAVGWNLLAGYTGQFSLAHHTFAGIGAYTSALLVQRAGIPILAGVRVWVSQMRIALRILDRGGLVAVPVVQCWGRNSAVSAVGQ